MQELTLRQLGEQFAALDGQTVKVYGWVRTIRDSKNFAFIELNDGTKFKSTQIVADADMEGYKNVVSQNVGAGLSVVGTVVVTPNAQQPYEIKAESMNRYGVPAEETESALIRMMTSTEPEPDPVVTSAPIGRRKKT